MDALQQVLCALIISTCIHKNNLDTFLFYLMIKRSNSCCDHLVYKIEVRIVQIKRRVFQLCEVK